MFHPIYKSDNILFQKVNKEEQNYNTIIPETSDISIAIDTVVLKKTNTFKINVKRINNNRLKSGYNYSIEYLGPKWWHYGMVIITYSSHPYTDVHVAWYRKYRWYSLSWEFSKSDLLVYYVNPNSQYYYWEYRIKTNVKSNWLNYDVYFKHFEEDDWTGG